MVLDGTRNQIVFSVSALVIARFMALSLMFCFLFLLLFCFMFLKCFSVLCFSFAINDA